jgi:hypothetical protein
MTPPEIHAVLTVSAEGLTRAAPNGDGTDNTSEDLDEP